MAKMAWLAIASLVLILLFSGCLNVITNSNSQSNYSASKCNETKCETCPPLVTCNETNIIRTTTIVANGSVSDEIAKCNVLEDTTQKNTCYSSLALAYEDPTLCERIVDYVAAYEEYEKDNCITSLAIKYNKPGYCNLLLYSSSCFNSFN
jgi:hypothetical protein